ncbi:hypothetical protein TNCT_644751 [Trichonephila clavata]|uniref:Uncharacterized protein n=1 Tax=Trichonephila clavata TaxID=2740835 RepID=A0A8X6LPD6_TRICU|nr:hypothetical protein TNCT_644751 [Trichonephila clavata]
MYCMCRCLTERYLRWFVLASTTAQQIWQQKITQYRYVCQSDMDEDGKIRVQFLTTIDGKRFTEIVNGILDVQCENVIAKLELEEPNIDVNIMFMEFSANRCI